MTILLVFFAGVFVGGTGGVLLMAALIMNARAEWEQGQRDG